MEIRPRLDDDDDDTAQTVLDTLPEDEYAQYMAVSGFASSCMRYGTETMLRMLFRLIDYRRHIDEQRGM